MPEKFKSKPECVKDKYGQEYAGIYVGDCELSDRPESRRDTLTFPNDTRRRTSQSLLGICVLINLQTVKRIFYFIRQIVWNYANKPYFVLDKSVASVAAAEIEQIRLRQNRLQPLQDDPYQKELRSLNRALITIGIFVICYLFTACVFSFLFGFLSSPHITSGEIIFIMVMLSVFRTLFSILIPIYNFDNILHVVKEYYGHAKFWINDTLESIYLFFS